VRPPTQYFGSKGRLAPWIAPLPPSHQAGWWRVEREVDKPSSLTSGGCAAHAVEAVWSNRPLHQQLQLAELPGPGPITQGVQP
jgi:hypothetical protein